MRRRAAALLAIAALVTSVSTAARAQVTVGGIALDQFEPAPAGDTLFGVPAPGVVGHLTPRATLMFDYAHRPLRLLGSGGDTDVVSGQGFLRVDASLALWNRLLVSVDVPVAVLQSGTEPERPGIAFHAPSSAAMGDLRLGARVRLFGADRGPFQLGLGGYLFVPTAPRGSYAGEGAVRGQLHVALGGRLPVPVPIVWNAAGGPLLRATDNPNAFTFGLGLAVLLLDERLQIGPELYGAAAISGRQPLTGGGATVTTRAGTGAELLVGARVKLPLGFFLGAAAGPGLTSAVGTPAVRVVTQVGWSAPVAAPRPAGAPGAPGDRDGDGLRDDVDACPDVPGGFNGDPATDGCPASDRDGDGVPDVEDACPTVPGDRSQDGTQSGCPRDSDGDGIPDKEDACPSRKGTASADPRQNGCPRDRDGDGVPDEVDACPDARGLPSADPKFHGCPEDSDGDGIKDPVDACPHERGAPDADPGRNGCPRHVRFTSKEVTLLVQVEFKSYGRFKNETIDPISDELLTEVRDVINQHPEILRIEVQGHSDNSGTAAANQSLSEARAREVRKWLIGAGIPADKLVAKGYGATQPIADNSTREGRQKNRRVRFLVITDRNH